MKIYISFGFDHAHAVTGKTFDKDSICEIECNDVADGRAKAFEAFGDKWSMQYNSLPDMNYFPRGVIKL